MNAKLSVQRLEELVAAYGSDLERFPESERAAARELVQSSEPARRLLEAERELDGLLAARIEPLPEALATFLDRVPERPRERPWRPRSRLMATVAWAAAAGLGLWLGAASAGDIELGDVEANASLGEDEAFVALAAGDLDGVDLAAGELWP